MKKTREREKRYGVVVHGGAGSLTPAKASELARKKRTLLDSASEGFKILERKGGDATDAVEIAINVLESSKIFNAGLGSCLTLDGNVSMDAAIMKGDLSCGAVADQNLSYRSISLARIVMERTDHVLMVGTASIQKLLNSLGESFEDQRVLPSFDKIERYRRLLSQYSKKGSEWPRNKLLLKDYMQKTVEVSDTVGAVALDLEGNVCAGVSTGGRWMKLPGRVGDSALIGAGLYADKDSGAISATGVGEEIIRLCLSKMVSDAMKTEGMDAQAACQLAIKTLTRVRGTNTAGLIAIDKAGRVGRSCNTPALPTAVRLNGMDRAMVVLFANEDLRIA